jgi:predicted glycosyltransferase
VTRVLFHVQHLLGVGHLRRAELLAEAMRAAGLDVTVALGGAPVPDVPFAGIDTVALPAAHIAGEDFGTLLDADGNAVDEVWKARRAAALLSLFHALRPEIVLLELFPFGRRQFRFELFPLLEAARQATPRPLVAASVRDILVSARKPGRAEEAAEIARSSLDAILVHADPDIVAFGATFPLADRLAGLVRYTGYVAPPPPVSASTEGVGEVVVSAGGGAVGAPLLFAALAARPATIVRDATWRFLTGPNLSDADYAGLAAAAGPKAIVERFRPDFSARLSNAALSISQAGYNTIMDIVRAQVPAVVVPYETPSETEQRLRADLLAARGLLGVVPAAALAPDTLATAIDAAFRRGKPSASKVDLDGAAHTAALVAQLLAESRNRPPPSRGEGLGVG